MSQMISLDEARLNLAQFVSIAAEGEEIVIARNGRPVARLVALAAGDWHGAVEQQVSSLSQNGCGAVLPDDIRAAFEFGYASHMGERHRV